MKQTSESGQKQIINDWQITGSDLCQTIVEFRTHARFNLSI